MRVVIDIDDNIYTRLFDNGLPIDLTTAINDTTDIATAIRNGTTLPEHHGRLIDADALLDESYQIDSMYCMYDEVVNVDDIKDAPTIIEGVRTNEASD